MNFADLHLHTRHSDGTYTPSELVCESVRLGFAAIAVTDHDTLAAIPEALRAGAAEGVEVIAGVEITCAIESREIHLLAYLFGDAWQDARLRSMLEHATQLRAERIAGFVAKLNEQGVPLTVADVLACSDNGTLGRPHIAKALVRRGLAATTDEAFARFLRRGRPAFVDRQRMSVAEAIAQVHRAGGVAVLAHPGLNHVDDHIPDMQAYGLDGIEVWYPKHSPAQTKHYLALAEQLGLLASGGSDCHGQSRGQPLLGAVKLPYERVEALRHRAARSSNLPPFQPSISR